MRNERRKSGSGRGGEKPVAERRHGACRLLLYVTVFRGDLGEGASVAELQNLSRTKREAKLDDRFHESGLEGTISCLVDSSFAIGETRSSIMAGQRRVIELAMNEEEVVQLGAISRSRTERTSRVARAQMLLNYRETPSFFTVGRRLGVHHQTVQRCVERAVDYGPLAALDDRPRPGKEPVITPEAKAWLVSLACDKAKDHGYPHELWTTRLLARHAREHGPTVGHACLASLVQGTVCKILGKEEIKPHKVRYYLEQRDAEFEQKMAEVLCVYREVEVLKKASAKSNRRRKLVAIISCDEKPGIQAIATTAPDLPPVPGAYATFARDHGTSAMARSACWPGLICLPARSMRSCEIAIAAASSSNCSSSSMLPTRSGPQSS
nr:helix-turn-helix domain-containing protein [Mesorhizobium sp. AR07]